MSFKDKLQDIQQVLDKIRVMDGIAPLLLRIYLAPIFIKAGYGKLVGFENNGSLVWQS